MTPDTITLQRYYEQRHAACAADPKFATLFATKWLPAVGVGNGTVINASLAAPLYPEVYVFGPRIHAALTCVTNTLHLIGGADLDIAATFAADLRRTYQDDFGDIHDYDWTIYQRYTTRNRLTYTSRIDRVYNFATGNKLPSLGLHAPGQVDFDIMLQEMLYFELLGPAMQKLRTDSLHAGAKRHALCVKKWGLRTVTSDRD